MKYKAVIFDLFGTLVDEDGDRYEQMLKDVASLWGIPFETFRQLWRASGVERNMGGFQTMEEQLAYVCAALDIAPGPEMLGEAADRYVDARRKTLEPRAGVVETLQQIQAKGLVRGLLSNCSFVDRDLWSGCEIAPHIDVPVLSAEVRFMKPDQRIFQLACTKLNLLPEECLFVGDGGSNELTAAKAFGMQSVLIRVPYDDVPAGSEVGEGEFWTGPRISSIPEVLGLLE